jgi:hypothetical protein
MSYLKFAVLATSAVIALVAALTPLNVSLAAVDDDEAANTQIAELYQLQAAFHRAASIHNPSGLDSPETINQRVSDMLSLWTGNRFVSLAPSFKTHFDIHGNTADVYFECHYFDANTWQDKSHVAFDGTADKDDGHWLLAHADAPSVGVPQP